MAPEEAAEEILKGPFEPCLYCDTTFQKLECKECHGTSRRLRERWAEAAVQLGLQKQLDHYRSAIRHAQWRAAQLLQEQRFTDQVKILNEKAKGIQERHETNRRKMLRELEQEYESRKLKR